MFALFIGPSAEAARPCAYFKKGVASHPPVLPAGVSIEKDWDLAYQDVFNVLCKNLKTPNNFFRGYRAHPGPPYKAAYLWDTAFISQIWMHWDPKIAQELLNYIFRFQRKDGLVHHAVIELLVKPYAYKQSQPPLLAWASWRIYEKSKDKLFLEQLYPKLKKYHEWLNKERRHSDGLYFWYHAYESGIDNSPRFSNRDESWFDNTRELASVDMSAYMAMSMEALEKIANELGNSADAKMYRGQYFDLKNVMNNKLWHEADGTYYDWDYCKQDFIRINTISNITPMAAGIPDTFKAMKLMKHIMDPKRYNTPIPFPSVARNESVFVKDMWRGPVWINMSYLGVLGVDRYGYKKEAAMLAKNTVKGIYETWKTHGYFYEFYDPERYDIHELHRKKGNLWKKLTLGSKPVKNFVGWTGLANTLVLEYGANWE